MSCSDEELYRAWLTYGGFQYNALRRLMEDMQSAEAVYARFRSEGTGWFQHYTRQPTLDSLCRRAEATELTLLRRRLDSFDMHVMYLQDPVYSEQLLTISDPPIFLFWRGSTACLRRRCLTMIGTRHPSVLAADATLDIARDLSNSGVAIVSGLATGIDQAAHSGCLMGKSPTIGVAGSGLDIPYPSGSKALKDRMLEQGGLLLSEYPPGTPGAKWQYPVRNRILSGLSRAVVMMECGEHSGSMNTVQHALDQGRDVFAWPGIPNSEPAAGAHQLLREGAAYFTSAQDILQDMGWDELPKPMEQAVGSLDSLTPEQRAICLQLRKGEQSLDELASATGMDGARLIAQLTILQLTDHVRALPGKLFKLV